MTQMVPLSNVISGLVIAAYSNDYEVLVGEKTYRCVLKGNQKKGGQTVLVGDRVAVDSLDDTNNLGRICEIQSRQNALIKPKIANVTTLMAMASVASPEFDPLQLDRYITQGLLAGLKVIVVLTKMDLCPKSLDIQAHQSHYEAIDLPVLSMTIHDPESTIRCLSAVSGEVVVMAGLSGVGKSSFLNSVRPELNLKVGEVSQKISRGMHTTRHASLIHVSENTFIADTPGFSQLKFDTVLPSDLKKAFPEFKQFDCYYPDCDHVLYENNIPAALPEGCYLEKNPEAISLSRLESYQTFLLESKMFEAQQKNSSQKEDASFKTLDKQSGKKSDQLRLNQRQRQDSRRTENQKIKILSGYEISEEDNDDA